MPDIIPYDRVKALEYTNKWSLGRNPRFFDYEKIGGDCTNFVSQVLLAGKCAMNYSKTLGWYYIDGHNKSPSWTGVNFQYNFLINNKTKGPFAHEVSVSDIEEGDIVQLNFQDDYYFDHSLIITTILGARNFSNILVSSHTYNRLNNPLLSLTFKDARFLHIEGSYI